MPEIAQREAEQLVAGVVEALLRHQVEQGDGVIWNDVFERIAADLRDALPFDGLIPILVLRRTLGVESAPLFRVFFLNDDPFDGEEAESLRVVQDCPTLNAAYESKTPCGCPDLAATVQGRDPYPFEKTLLERNARSVLVLPVGSEPNDADDIAVLFVFYHAEPNRYGEREYSIANALRAPLLMGLRNVHYRHNHLRRQRHTRIISEVSAELIRQLLSPDELYHRVVELICSHFAYYDVAVFRVEWDTQQLALAAHEGDYRYYLDLNYRQSIHVGILGHVALSGESYVTNDADSDPIFYLAFPSDIHIRSELAVPIKLDELVLAVLEVQSMDAGAFDAYDVESLEVLCQILARAIQTADYFDQIRELKEFNRQILDTMPSSVLVLDDSFHAVYANEQFCALLNKELVSILYQPIDAICSHYLMETAGLRALLERIISVQACAFLTEVRLFADPMSRIVDIRVCKTWDSPGKYVLMLDDVTTRAHQLEQMKMLQGLGEQLQRTLDLDSLLHAILTCVTAGPGFGFNRAMLFLTNHEETKLDEWLHIGPTSHEDAIRIWNAIGSQPLEALLAEPTNAAKSDVQFAARRVVLDTTPSELRELLDWGMPFLVRPDESHRSRFVSALRQLSEADETIIIPLCSRGRVIGVILADNMFTRQPVSDRTLQSLSAFASQAALAIANAIAYSELAHTVEELEKTRDQLIHTVEELQSTRDKLVHAEKLGIIGKLGASVAHEIRNPLVSIGAWARRIQKTTKEPKTSERVDIIVREVARLEVILKELMDFASPNAPDMKRVSLPTVARHVISLLTESAAESGVRIVFDCAEPLSDVKGDASRLEQVVLNLSKNAIEAMPNGGTLTIRLYDDAPFVVCEIRDTGDGIDAERLKRIFDPFFTTKRHGTGLGLMITKKIVDQHGGTIEARSAIDVGTTFLIRLARYEESSDTQEISA
jgi:hypothetical protein